MEVDNTSVTSSKRRGNTGRPVEPGAPGGTRKSRVDEGPLPDPAVVRTPPVPTIMSTEFKQ